MVHRLAVILLSALLICSWSAPVRCAIQRCESCTTSFSSSHTSPSCDPNTTDHSFCPCCGPDCPCASSAPTENPTPDPQPAPTAPGGSELWRTLAEANRFAIDTITGPALPLADDHSRTDRSTCAAPSSVSQRLAVTCVRTT